MADLRSVAVGEGTISVFEVGMLRMKISEIIRKESTLPEGIAYDSIIVLPIYNALIKLKDVAIIVDPCDYDSLLPIEDPSRPEGYSSPPNLVDQLSEVGTRPDGITHEVITHAHSDHFNGATIKKSGKYVPSFPRAKYYLGLADWKWNEIQKELKQKSVVSNSLGVLHSSSQLALVKGETEIAPGVFIIPMPGESPGHQILKVESRGELLYCIGDLFHAAMDVVDPRIMADFNDPEANLESRMSFLSQASKDGGLIFGGHMSLGRVVPASEGYKWVGIH